MACPFQHDIPEHEIPEEWQTILTEHACALEAILTWIAKTVMAVTTRPDRSLALEERLHTLLTEAERFLMTMAQQNIDFERETAQFQAINEASLASSPETTERLQVLDHVNTLLHANITVARQCLTDLRHTMEHGESRR